MTDQERIAAFCELVDECLDRIITDSYLIEYDGNDDYRKKHNDLEELRQKFETLVPASIASNMWSLKPENRKP